LRATVERSSLIGQASHGSDVVQVGGDELGATPLGLDRRDGLRAAFDVAPGDDDGGAAAGEQLGGFPADARGRAGHQHTLVS
jgi:hypothetical protein